jgi:hypothetical protein
VLIVLAVAAVVVGMLLPYGDDGPPTPLGSDTPHHVWRMRLVAADGLDALPVYRGSHLLNANGDRVGLPIFAAVARSAGGPEALGAAFVVPAVFAAIIALAAVAVCQLGIEEPPVAAPLYALAAGASLAVVFAANGPLEQLMASAMLLGAIAVLVPAAAGDRGAAAAAVILLAGAWATHWVVTATLAVVIVAWAGWLALVPGTELAPETDRRRAALRLVTVVGIAAVACVVVSLSTPAPPQLPLGVTDEGVQGNLDRQLPEYLRSGLLAAAAIGVAVLAVVRGRPRATVGSLLGWALLPVGGLLLGVVVETVPLHRLISIALAIPVLAAAGAVGVGRLVRSGAGTARTVVGVAVALAVVVALAVEAWGVWGARQPSTQPKVAAQLAELGRAAADLDRPLILVVDDVPGSDKTGDGFGTIPALRRLRAALPATMIPRTWVYLGDPARAAGGEVTLRPDIPGYDESALDAWGAVEPLLAEDPTIVVLRPYVDDFEALASAHPSWVRAPWLLVAAGELPSVAAEPPALAPPEPASLAGWTLWMLGLATLVGLGWSLGLVRGAITVRAALAPCVGLGLVVLGGLVVELLGHESGGTWGVGAALVIGAAGAMFAIGRAISGARSG